MVEAKTQLLWSETKTKKTKKTRQKKLGRNKGIPKTETEMQNASGGGGRSE